MASNSLATSEIDTVKLEIAETAAEIKKVQRELNEVDTAIERKDAYRGINGERLYGRLDALQKEEEQLRKKEEQLREKELRLPPPQPAAAASGAPQKMNSTPSQW